MRQTGHQAGYALTAANLLYLADWGAFVLEASGAACSGWVRGHLVVR